MMFQEAQGEIKSTVTVNTNDMSSKSETKDGSKETEKERIRHACRSLTCYLLYRCIAWPF